MKLCKDCANRNKRPQCSLYSTQSNYAERCKDFEQIKQTNGDRIRGMSDEELAEFIYSQVQAKCSARDCVGADTCYYHADWNGECGDGCERAILRWLQSEVEG